MNISVNILLAEGEEMTKTTTEVAEDVLLAVGGDSDTDFVQVTLQHAHPPGYAGTQPVPPPPEEPPE